MTIIPKIKHVAIAILVFFSAPQAVFAATVLQIDVDYLLSKAVLVFEGEVVSSEARWNQNETTITTFITFRVKDVIKGKPRSSTVMLGFSGGTVGETGLQVSGMVYPSVGESGIYFFENPGRQQVNPLVGWGQGHFRVKKDNNGKERIVTEGGVPVLGLDVSEMSSANRGIVNKPSLSPFSHGVANGVRTGKSEDALSAAIGKKQFKDSLKARLENIKSNDNSRHGATGK